MCMPKPQAAAPIEAPPPVPAYRAPATQQRVDEVAKPPAMDISRTVLTSPLGVTDFGSSVRRTVLTGVLS